MDIYIVGISMANRTINITCAYGKPTIDGVVVPTGNNTVADGSHVFAVLREYVVGSTRRCTGWTGTGDFADGGSGHSVTMTITQNGTLVWTWKTMGKCPVCKDTIIPTEGDSGVKAVCGSCGYDDSQTNKWSET
jgi:hypothetical protein